MLREDDIIRNIQIRNYKQNRLSIISAMIWGGTFETTLLTRGGGGGGTPLYKLYRYVPPQRVWFLSRFGLKTGIDFDHYGLKSGMVFEGTTRAYKRICLFNAKLKSREREVSKIYNSS